MIRKVRLLLPWYMVTERLRVQQVLSDTVERQATFSVNTLSGHKGWQL